MVQLDQWIRACSSPSCAVFNRKSQLSSEIETHSNLVFVSSCEINTWVGGQENSALAGNSIGDPGNVATSSDPVLNNCPILL